MCRLRLPPLPSVRDLVKLYRLRALKQLSQNFLMDERITDRIVKAAGKINGHYVCEVGPGPGSITRSLIKHEPKRLIVVEKDPRFLPSLELIQEACKTHVDMNIEIGDIRTFNLEKCFEGAPKVEWTHSIPPIHLIGNLPFNISTILVIHWLEYISQKSSAWKYGRTSMTLTFQKEVGQRMIASNRTRERCRLSVMCQLWCEVHYKFTIPGTAFVPKPDVDVAVVTLIPLKTPMIDMPFKVVEKVIRTIFNTRQKFCRKSAEKLFPENLRDLLGPKLFILAGVDPSTRPYQLTNEEFVQLCYAYKIIYDEFPEVLDYNYRMAKRFTGNELDNASISLL